MREVARGRMQHPSLPTAPKPEVGLVLHFVKAQETRVAGQRVLYADPSARTARSRHGLWFQDRSAEAAAICRSLRMHPEHLLLLRGIDVANTELAQPTWVLLPLWKQVFAVVHEVAALLGRRKPYWGVLSTPVANYRFSLISAGPARSTPRLRSLSSTHFSFPFAALLSCVLVGNTGTVACVGASVERS